MNWVDFIIILVFCFYLFEGIRRGFIEQTFELLGFFLTLSLAFSAYQPFGKVVSDYTGLEELVAGPVAFFIAWFIFQMLYSLMLHFAYPQIPSKLRLAITNRLSGILPAFAKGFIIVAIILTMILLLPVPSKLKASIEESALGSQFVNTTATVEQYLSKIAGGDIKQTLTFLTVPPRTEEVIAPDERVDLKFQTTDVKVDTLSEQKMLELINQERAKNGVRLLVWDPTVAQIARDHSRDMFARGYFSHENLDGLSPFDRLQRAGLTFKIAGENIAYAATVDLAHNGLMRSAGHRRNILDESFGRVGIGVIDGGVYGKMFTQNFRD